MVMAGADEYFCVFTVVLVLAGQPALTATSLPGPAAWRPRSSRRRGGRVLTLDWDPTVLLLLSPETRNTIPTTTPAMTTTMMPLRICLRRFWLWASAASRPPGPPLAGSLLAGHGPRPYLIRGQLGSPRGGGLGPSGDTGAGRNGAGPH